MTTKRINDIFRKIDKHRMHTHKSIKLHMFDAFHILFLNILMKYKKNIIELKGKKTFIMVLVQVMLR